MAETIESFRDLKAWKLAMRFGLDVYETTKQFPDEERFGLISQMRRAAVSIASNIAEGYGRQSRTDYLRFLKIARSSLFELETQLWFALKLNYVGEPEFNTLLQSQEECAKTLAGLIRSVSQSGHQ